VSETLDRSETGALQDASGGRLQHQQRLVLRPLSVTRQDNEFLVGDPVGGDFVALPEIAIIIIDAIRSGHSLGEVAEIAARHAGEDVDVIDFAETLIELGFVAEIDSHPLDGQARRRGDGGRIGEWLAQLARPLFSSPAWLVYGALFTACVATLVIQPRFRPRGSDLLFLPNPAESIALVTLAGCLIASLHECAHWLAARVEGVPARIGVGRRWYFLVLQTDLTALWSLPRRRRFGPLLAGMALHSVLLSVLLTARITAHAGIWHPATTVTRLIAALAASTVVGLAFQFFIFLRTDLYAVLVTRLGCLNLTRVTQLVLKRSVRELPERERFELDQASSNDLRTARWYRWLYLAGILGAAWFFVTFFGPDVLTITRWTASSLRSTAPSQPAFWEALLFAALALAPVVLTILLYLQERFRRLAAHERSSNT
jgi:putative peptide zinc metalloprotease protein